MSTAYEFGKLIKQADETWAQRAYKNTGRALSQFGSDYMNYMGQNLRGAGNAIASGASAAGNAIADGASVAGNAIADGASAVGRGLSAANDAVGLATGVQVPTLNDFGYYAQRTPVAKGLGALKDLVVAGGQTGGGLVSEGVRRAGNAVDAFTDPTNVDAPFAAAGTELLGGKEPPKPAPTEQPGMLGQASDWVKNNPGYAALGAGGLGLGAYGLYNMLNGKKKRTKASSVSGRDRVLNKAGFYVPAGSVSSGLSSDMAGLISATSAAKKKKKPKAKYDSALDILHQRVGEKSRSNSDDIDPGDLDLNVKSAYKFGAAIKRATMLGDFANGLSTSWNNASRVFKGGTGAIAGGIGAAGAGLAGGAMQGANAVGGLFGAQPFSNETIDTAHGVADHYANMGSAYGKDLAQGLGLGEHGLAGTTMDNPSAGDDYIKQVQQQPGVTDEARRISNMGMATADLAAKAAPAAAIGGGIQMASNLASGAPLTTGISSFSPAAPAASATAPAAQTAGTLAKATQKVTGVAKNLNSTSNPLGWGTGAGINAARTYQNYQPATALAGK